MLIVHFSRLPSGRGGKRALLDRNVKGIQSANDLSTPRVNTHHRWTAAASKDQLKADVLVRNRVIHGQKLRIYIYIYTYMYICVYYINSPNQGPWWYDVYIYILYIYICL